ncbi:MAG: type 1 glutamine amidotransferase [Acidimicrobiales bacterium]
MRVFVIRHHEEDGAGFIGDAFEDRGAALTTHVFPDEGPLPSVEDFDAIVVLGAKWSVYDEATVGAWIGDEFEWLRGADGCGVPILGICLGAQVLAAAFGGGVEPAPEPEIGWKTIASVGPPVIGPGPWLQFHFDRCVLPDDAVLLADNDIGPQAFSLGRNLAVQFHPEVDGAQLARWFGYGEREIAMAAGTDPDALLAETIAQEGGARKRAADVVRVFLERAVVHAGEAAR